jgi:hypothetical protein
MPKICYDAGIATRLKANKKQLAVVLNANSIIDIYRAQGFMLTLRQIYYQFVARDLFPEDRYWFQKEGKWVKDPERKNPNSSKNAEPNYKWLGELLNDGRVAGLVDWDSMEDRTRNLRMLPHWDTPADILVSVAQQYRVDLWEHQQTYIEVWVEKEALIQVVQIACNPLDIPYFACKGYVSQSELWGAAQRLKALNKKGKDAVVLYFGDHDPSGIDMTRDIGARLRQFGARVDVRRLALNMDQILELNPPPSPAKIADSRCKGYVEQFGEDSWELDAMEPAALTQLIRDEVSELAEKAQWKKDQFRQKSGRAQLKAVSDRWDDVEELVATDWDVTDEDDFDEEGDS